MELDELIVWEVGSQHGAESGQYIQFKVFQCKHISVPGYQLTHLRYLFLAASWCTATFPVASWTSQNFQCGDDVELVLGNKQQFAEDSKVGFLSPSLKHLWGSYFMDWHVFDRGSCFYASLSLKIRLQSKVVLQICPLFCYFTKTFSISSSSGFKESGSSSSVPPLAKGFYRVASNTRMALLGRYM